MGAGLRPKRRAANEPTHQAPFEMRHEIHHPRRRGRHMTVDLRVLPSPSPKRPGPDWTDDAVGRRHNPKFLRHCLIRGAMNPADELDRDRRRQCARQVEFVDPAMRQHMRALRTPKGDARVRLKPQPMRVRYPGPRVAPLDQIRIVAIHDANEIGEFGSRLGMESRPERRGFSLYRLERNAPIHLGHLKTVTQDGQLPSNRRR
ncbi:hypothetical protein GGD83_003368 [Rhodoblastus sphagnicola]|nr:hypothetical protein [Rhodoblastus sphagnicola]